MRCRWERMRRDEQGSVLVLVLVVLVVVGVLVSALLALVDTGLRTSRVVQDQRLVSYSADGAVDAAVHSMRSDKELGRDPDLGGSCPDFVLPDTNGTATLVTCEGRADSGKVTQPGQSGVGTAIRAVGQDPAEVGLAQTSNSLLRVNGNVQVNSSISISANAARLDVTSGAVAAVGSCPFEKITATDGVRCGPAQVSGPFATPVVARQTVDTTVRTAPACDTGQVVQSLEPGTYRDAAALSSLTSCPRSIVHLTPGVYYLDFLGPNQVWSMTSSTTHVVGGAPTSAWTPAPASSALPLTDVAMCDTTKSGVQLVFGATSRLNVSSGYLELCPVAGDATRTVLYGATADTAPPPVTVTTKAGSVAASTGFTQADRAVKIDGASATATVKSSSASVTLDGYGVPGLSADTGIESVILRVAHDEGASSNGSNPVLKAVLSGPGFSCDVAVPVVTSFTTAGIPVESCLSTPERLQSFRVQYVMTNDKNPTATTALDGIEVVVTYSPGGVRAQSGCITASGYGLSDDASRCALLTTSGSNTGLVLRGSVYAPRAVLNVALPGGSAQRFEHGFVARALRLQINPSTSYVGPVVAIPAGSVVPEERADRTVDLVAHDEAGAALLRATVTFDDEGGRTPGRAVKVSAWNVSRS